MSSIEEINRKIEQVTKEIGEVQTAINKWENDIGNN
jgi:peptidoglycan hydrolase CwlO-like protein